MKKINIMTAAFVTVAALGFVGCQNAENTNKPAVNSTNSSNANTVATPSAPAASPAADSEVGSLATPTDAYKTAYMLRKKKDVAGLKKVMSKDILEFFEMIGKDDGKTVDDMIEEMTEKPQAATAEVRNEKIDGNKATIEYLDEKGEWKVMDFEKVGSNWLMSFPKADAKSDKPSDKE